MRQGGTRKGRAAIAGEARKSKGVYLRIPAEMWDAIREEMKTKELVTPQPVILAALRRQYSIQVQL